MLSAVVDCDADHVFLIGIPDGDGDPPVSRRMVDGIVQIVSHDLLDAELIGIYLNVLRTVKFYGKLLLPEDDAGFGDDAADKLRKAERSHFPGFLPEFQRT